VTRIQHVLFDADGVLQYLPGGWYAAMEPYLGDRTREFLHKTWKEELPTLAGQGDYLSLLAAALVEYGVTTPVEAVYKNVWHNIAMIDESFRVVHALRRRGYGGGVRARHGKTRQSWRCCARRSCRRLRLGW